MTRTRKSWRRECFIPACVALLALAVRLYYVNTAIVIDPVRGDAVQYVIYATNLLAHGVFSMQRDLVHPLPDNFRDPGYPAFLALCMSIFGRGPSFYVAVLDIQAVLSGLTAGMGAWLARRYMGALASILVGLGLVVWPHLVSAPGYLLSECLVGFLIMLAVVTLGLAIDRRSWAIASVSGVAFAAAALGNAVLLPLAPSIAAIAAWKDAPRRRLWITLAAAAALPCAAWLARGVMIEAPPGSDSRIIMNFVQGSWPDYHPAWQAATIRQDPNGAAVLGEIDTDYRQMLANPRAGLIRVGQRLAASPWRSVRWYASKPAELWGWSIGIGAGDIYVFPTINSPLSKPGLLGVTSAISFVITPLLAVLALLGAIAASLKWRRTHPVILVIAATAIYVTAVFTTLQADARYSAPYRPFEWLLAGYAVACVFRSLRDRRATSSEADDAPTSH